MTPESSIQQSPCYLEHSDNIIPSAFAKTNYHSESENKKEDEKSLLVDIEFSSSTTDDTMGSSITDDTDDMEYEDEVFDLPLSTIIIPGNKFLENPSSFKTYCPYTKKTIDAMVKELNVHGFKNHFESTKSYNLPEHLKRGSNNASYNLSERGSNITPYNQLEWGTEHPEFKLNKRRVVWSDAEKKYISLWLKHTGTNIMQRRISCLLAEIRGDVSAHKIFHVNHIVDVTRLRHGVRIVEDPEFGSDKKAIHYI